MEEEVRVLNDRLLQVQDQLVRLWLVTSVTLIDVLLCLQQHGTKREEKEFEHS